MNLICEYEGEKMTKKDFILWENEIFGYGYGTGELSILKVLKKFMDVIPKEESYDYEILEKILSPEVTWLLINILCHSDIIEYGCSPRFGWLSDRGKELQLFLKLYTTEELYEILNEEPMEMQNEK